MMLNMFVCMHYGLLLLMYLWTTLSGVDAALPRYCGRRGSGVDALGAPAGDLDLVQIQVVTRHGARTPTGDCARWLPGARARWNCRGAVLEGATVGGAATDLRLARSFASVDGALPGTCELGQLLDEGYAQHAGQDKRAKFPTSKAPFSAVFHSFRLIFGRAIISRNGLEA